jgi:hypothetical protein
MRYTIGLALELANAGTKGLRLLLVWKPSFDYVGALSMLRMTRGGAYRKMG